MNKIKWFLLVWAMLITSISVVAQKLKPYTIAGISEENVAVVAEQVKANLESNDFEILGSYNPEGNPNKIIIAYTSSEIKQAVSEVAGLTGFALTWRVAITAEEKGTVISYNTPEYWGNAYFTKKYNKIADLYKTYNDKIAGTFMDLGEKHGEQFGSEKGLETGRLQRYRYKVLMPQFNDTHVLAKFDSYEDAVSAIDFNLSNGIENLTEVYSVELKDKNLKLYGIGLSGEKGEGKFMPTIDIASPKHTAFLPYEILVVDNKVHMLHGRFRIALSFPDLSMGTFMKIVSTPGNIKEMLEKVCSNEI